jgi:hypothetical protein
MFQRAIARLMIRGDHPATGGARIMKRLLTLFALIATLTAASPAWAHDDEEKGRNFNAVLRPAAGGPEDGSGTVKFRQPRDENKIAYLEVGLRGLLPHNAYYFERAVDMEVNDDCAAATNWLRLGAGIVPSAIATDNKGKGRALLFRDLAAVPEGTQFDIHFRVIDAITGATVLVSDCYQYTVRQ